MKKICFSEKKYAGVSSDLKWVDVSTFFLEAMAAIMESYFQ